MIWLVGVSKAEWENRFQREGSSDIFCQSKWNMSSRIRLVFRLLTVDEIIQPRPNCWMPWLTLPVGRLEQMAPCLKTVGLKPEWGNSIEYECLWEWGGALIWFEKRSQRMLISEMFSLDFDVWSFLPVLLCIPVICSELIIILYLLNPLNTSDRVWQFSCGFQRKVDCSPDA